MGALNDTNNKLDNWIWPSVYVNVWWVWGAGLNLWYLQEGE